MDLEVQVVRTRRRVAGVADVADHIPLLDLRAHRQTRGEAAEVGVEEVRLGVGVGEVPGVARQRGARRSVQDLAVQRAVDHRQHLRTEWGGDVLALMRVTGARCAELVEHHTAHHRLEREEVVGRWRGRRLGRRRGTTLHRGRRLRRVEPHCRRARRRRLHDGLQATRIGAHRGDTAGGQRERGGRPGNGQDTGDQVAMGNPATLSRPCQPSPTARSPSRISWSCGSAMGTSRAACHSTAASSRRPSACSARARASWA